MIIKIILAYLVIGNTNMYKILSGIANDEEGIVKIKTYTTQTLYDKIIFEWHMQNVDSTPYMGIRENKAAICKQYKNTWLYQSKESRQQIDQPDTIKGLYTNKYFICMLKHKTKKAFNFCSPQI